MARTRHPKPGKAPNVAILAALRRHRVSRALFPGDHSYSQNPLPVVSSPAKKSRRSLIVLVEDFVLSHGTRYFKVRYFPNYQGGEG